MDNKEKSLKIGNRVLTEREIFVIAEIGVNHNGSMNKAFKLIDQAKSSGADCVKFQFRCLNETYSKDALKLTTADLGAQYTIGLLKRFNLTFNQIKKIQSYCKKKSILFLCTPWDKKSSDLLDKIKVSAFKVASADMTNHDLIEHLCKKGKPLILSTGMSTQKEINATVKLLKKYDKTLDFALLHCNSTYPAPFKDLNLSYITRLKKFNKLVGYSGHERGISATLASVGFGARIIERHITLDKDMEGPDHAASLEQEEFNTLVQGLREIEAGIGNCADRHITQGELINRENLSKSIYLTRDLKKNQKISKNMLEFKSPGQGLQPYMIDNLIGKKVNKDLKKGNPLFMSDLGTIIKPKSEYQFTNYWGIPVRYHDISKLLEISSPNFVEFHMSFNDLEYKPNKFLKRKYNCDFLVHAPELFKNDHLLDLCTTDTQYRKKSIQYMQKLIEHTINLKEFFPNSSIPKIIVNCGGFSRDRFIDKNIKKKYYDNLIRSLKIINSSEIEIIPQTMAPYPWHFGGQRYQNLFMDRNEIKKFCKKMKMRICNDVSHSYLACNTFNWDFYSYIEDLRDVTTHYHISDGIETSGEGLQIGCGTIDFEKLCRIVKNHKEKITFIPEVWQGHTNNGEGFWKSLNFLDKKL